MNVAREGNQIYNDIKHDAVRCAVYLSAYSELTDSQYLTSNGGSQVTSSMVNGQSFTVLPGMSTAHRKEVLRWVAACLANGGPISSTQISTF